jgi:hypothetical protein
VKVFASLCFEIEVNKFTGEKVSRKLILLFFTYRKQLNVTARFITD